MKNTIFIIISFGMLVGNFVGMNDGARSLGMGNAFVALSDETSAIFHNPSGLAKINEYSLIASMQNIYGIPDLSNNMIAISFPTPYLKTGLAIQQINLVNTYTEQIIYLSVAKATKSKSTPIYFGISFKYESAKVKTYHDVKNPKNLDLDVGILIDISKNLFVGYSLTNALEPKFKFISDGDKLNREHRIGIYHNWKNSVNFLADYIVKDDTSQWNFGSEIWFYNVFAARLGILDENLTIGFGINADKWIIDGAVIAHEELGSSYRGSLGLKFGNKE